MYYELYQGRIAFLGSDAPQKSELMQIKADHNKERPIQS